MGKAALQVKDEWIDGKDMNRKASSCLVMNGLSRVWSLVVSGSPLIAKGATGPLLAIITNYHPFWTGLDFQTFAQYH